MDATLPLADGRRFDLAHDGPVVRARRNVTLDTASGGLDIIQRVPGVPGFAALAADAVESDLLGVRVRLCSLSRLREMKGASGRTQDRADLENLPPA